MHGSSGGLSCGHIVVLLPLGGGQRLAEAKKKIDGSDYHVRERCAAKN
jgi:hypothetical protein